MFTRSNKGQIFYNGSYYYDAKEPEVDFSWYEEETIRWDELANWDDVE